ncbi:hypothetical protein EC973_004194 [Apophysomyces ossiformis]|uniref:SH3 domain-containing protein n=1 Tax=Apophysomyces ossiformis TaxID=679940 RepID=A0A8H7ESK4_9FUNG|nr:hypothetical protein EC973_004194 [Apophysomyces ossiformis]
MVSNVVDDLSAESLSFASNFWGYDRRGMDALLGQVQASFDVLSRLQTIYYERAQLEQEFGQNLMALCASDEDEEEATEGLIYAMKSVNMELKKTGQSHIDLARRLKEQVASELDQWLIERGEAIDTVRDQYFRLHQSSTGPTTELQALEKEYHTTLTAIEDTVDQWNSSWKQTCDELELIEIQRIDFIMGNVWDYANLTTAQFMVQDEWCEKIRSSLETLDVKTELARYMHHRTGSTIPSVSDYILHALQTDTLELPPMKAKQLPPRPMSSVLGTMMGGTTTAAARVKRKPLPTLQERKKKENRGSLEELLDRLEISPSNKQNHDSGVPASSLACTTKTQREPEERDEEQIDKKKKKKNELEYGTRRLESSHELMRTLSQATSTLSNEPAQPCMQSAAPSSVPPTTQAGFIYHPPKSPRPSAQGLKKPDQQEQGQGQEPEDHHAIHPSHAFSMATTTTTTTTTPIPGTTIPSHYHHHFPPAPAPSPLPFSPSPSSQGWDVPVPMTFPPPSPTYGPVISSSLSNGGLLPSSLSSAPSPMMQAQDRTVHTPSSPMMLPSSSAQGRPYYAPSSPMMMMATTAGHPTNSTVIGPSSALPTSPLLPMLSPQPPAAAATTTTAAAAVSMSSCYPSPCPSPRMMTNQPSSSFSYPPATGLPFQLADGRPILQWARAKFDYFAQDEMEITFRRGTLLALYGLSPFEGWWMAEVWDESSQRWCGSGCVPGNFIRTL